MQRVVCALGASLLVVASAGSVLAQGGGVSDIGPDDDLSALFVTHLPGDPFHGVMLEDFVGTPPDGGVTVELLDLGPIVIIAEDPVFVQERRIYATLQEIAGLQALIDDNCAAFEALEPQIVAAEEAVAEAGRAFEQAQAAWNALPLASRYAATLATAELAAIHKARATRRTARETVSGLVKSWSHAFRRKQDLREDVFLARERLAELLSQDPAGRGRLMAVYQEELAETVEERLATEAALAEMSRQLELLQAALAQLVERTEAIRRESERALHMTPEGFDGAGLVELPGFLGEIEAEEARCEALEPAFQRPCLGNNTSNAFYLVEFANGLQGPDLRVQDLGELMHLRDQAIEARTRLRDKAEGD